MFYPHPIKPKKPSAKGKGEADNPSGKGSLRILPQTLLCALALAISGVEMLIPPLPMLPPGAKPGFSNIVTMYAAGSLGIVPALGIALIKGIFAGVTRGFTAFLMSTCGGILSTLVMGCLLHIEKRPFSLIGVGIAGAHAHNAAQLGVAVVLTSSAVVAYAPFLLLFSLITGTVTGLILRAVLPALNKISQHC